MRNSSGFILSLMLCITFPQYLSSDSKDIVVMEGDTPYSQQVWFSSGSGVGLQENYIKEYWDQGYRISSLAYGSSGWTVVMSSDSGYTLQTYYYTENWPADWVDEKLSEGYRLTSFAYGNNMWTVVMSQGTSITSQGWKTCSVTELKATIDDWWTDGYHISGVACIGSDKWLVCVSDNMPYDRQAWSVCNSSESAKDAIYEYWEQGYNLSLLVYGDNRYFIVVSKYDDAHDPIQWYIIDNTLSSDIIKEKWNENLRIACVGGGTDYYTYDNTGYASSQNNTFLPGDGEKIIMQRSDGYPAYIQLTPYYFRDNEGNMLYNCLHTGLRESMGAFSGYCYRHDYDEGGYHVLKKFFYTLSGGGVSLSPVDGQDLKVSVSDGSIVNSYGVVWNIPLDDEQASEIRKNFGKITQWAEYMTGGGHTVPSLPSGNNSGNDSTSGNRKSRCSYCNGTGVCQSCHGRGGYYDWYGYSNEKTWRQCPSCHGSGRCFNCYGSGYL